MKRQYYRHLPHQIPEGFPIFLTWNLKGALPKAVLEMQLMKSMAYRTRGAGRSGRTNLSTTGPEMTLNYFGSLNISKTTRWLPDCVGTRKIGFGLRLAIVNVGHAASHFQSRRSGFPA